MVRDHRHTNKHRYPTTLSVVVKEVSIRKMGIYSIIDEDGNLYECPSNGGGEPGLDIHITSALEKYGRWVQN